MPKRDEIEISYKPGEVLDVEMHDGSTLMLKKLQLDYDPKDRIEALKMLETTCCGGVLVTGLIYFNEDRPALDELEDLVETPLSRLDAAQMRPPEESLQDLMGEFR